MIDLGDYVRKAFKFMIIGAIGALVNWALLYFFVEYLSVWYLTAEIIATIIVFGVNFNGNILIKNIKIGKNAPKIASPPTIMKAENPAEPQNLPSAKN
jgi:hypothetical protein